MLKRMLTAAVIGLCSANLIYFYFATNSPQNAVNPINSARSMLDENEPITPRFKIAFLFLTMDNVETPKIWDKFFGNKNDKKYYNIYVHPKYPSNISLSQLYIYNNILPRNLLIDNTERFQFSLVEASNALFKYALNDDKLNKKFVLLSETTIPLFNLNKIYDKLMYDDNNLSFGLEQGTVGKKQCFEDIYERIFNHYQEKIGKNISMIEFAEKYVAYNDCVHTSQWLVLDRYIIKNYLLKYEDYWNKFYLGINGSFADEDYYANMVRKFIKTEKEREWIKPKSVQYYYFHPLDWTHAAYFDNISNEWIDDLRNDGYLFMRKVNQSSIIDINYVLH